VLDLPKTLEVLETLGVPVVGVGTRELPGFYSRETGLTLEHQVADAPEAARLLRARQALGQGGVVFCLPPPAETSLPRAEVERHLAAALGAARRRKVTGKAVTPFLLSELARRTRGRSLTANLALLEHNAAFAGRLAVELGRR
jgi:pseudouridine-5'-phosphate glycosidase